MNSKSSRTWVPHPRGLGGKGVCQPHTHAHTQSQQKKIEKEYKKPEDVEPNFLTTPPLPLLPFRSDLLKLFHLYCFKTSWLPTSKPVLESDQLQGPPKPLYSLKPHCPLSPFTSPPNLPIPSTEEFFLKLALVEPANLT